MIITFTPNPAIDMTYSVDTLRRGETHAVAQVRERSGGKGVNTAAVLSTMGTPCVALCPTGQQDLTIFGADLDARRVAHDLVPVPGRVRRSVAAVEPDGHATVFNEPGTTWPAADVLARLAQLAAPGSSEAGDVGRVVLAVCGSIPVGCEDDVIGAIRLAQDAGATCLLDLRGEALRRSLSLRPALVKPNRAEAAETLGLDPTDPPPTVDLAGRLLTAGARTAVVSDGPRGVTLASEDGARVHAVLPNPLQGNATGAGDALTAALATHLATAEGLGSAAPDWRAALIDGVAYSAAAVLQPVAGQIDPADVIDLRAHVVLTEID